MRLLHFIFFSLGLPLILQATASDNESSRKPQKRHQISSDNTGDSEPQQKRTREVDILPDKSSKRRYSSSDDNSDHQQKRIRESNEFNILPDKSSKRRHSSSNDKNDGTNGSQRQVLRKDTPRTSKLPATVKHNLTKGKLKKKTKIQKRIKSVSLSEENTPKKRYLNDFLELVVPHTPPIQDLFFKHFTNIYSFDRKTKTLILNGDNSSEGFSWEVYVLRVCYSKLSIKTLIFKNLTIGRNIFETIIYFLSCYQNTLEVLIFDHCFFSSNFAIQNYSNLDKLHTAKITYCALNEEILKKTLSLFPNSLKTLEISHLCCNSSVDNYQHYGEYLLLDFSGLDLKCFSTLKNLAIKKNDIMNFRFENFKNLEEIEVNDNLFKSYDLLKEFYTLIKPIITDCTDLSFGIDLSTLGSKLSEWNDLIEKELPYLLSAIYISAEVITTEFVNELNLISESITLKYRDLLELQESVNYNSDNLHELRLKFLEISNEICKLRNLIPKECPKLSDRLNKLKNLKTIKTDEYDFRDYLDCFASRNIIVDSNTHMEILHNDLPNIRKILLTFANVYFCLPNFTANDINAIRFDDESNFESLKKVTFYRITNTDNIAFIKYILKCCYNIRTITFNLSVENITAEQIAESFNEMKTYDKIENVNFTVSSCNDASATCEFIFQMLKRVLNLKYLLFECSNEDVIDMLFNRIQKEKLKFTNLQKIDTKNYNGSINLLLWFMQTFPIEELNIDSYNLSCSPNDALDNFLNKRLRKLCIDQLPTTNDVLLKNIFNGMVNLKELYFNCNSDLVTLFENNSTIETIIFKGTLFQHEHSGMIFSTLETFKSLKRIYMKFHENSHSYVTSTFNNHFRDKKVEGREDKDSRVELIFYSEDGYFQ